MTAFNQISSSTSRTTLRPSVLNPVGRYGVAKNARWREATAASEAAIAASSTAGDEVAEASRTAATSARRRAASVRQALEAAPRNGSRRAAGQSRATAANAATEADPQPASRSGIEEAFPGRDTGKMNARSSATVEPARTELTTPAKSTPNPTNPIAAAASHADDETSVAMQTNSAPTTASAAWA